MTRWARAAAAVAGLAALAGCAAPQQAGGGPAPTRFKLPAAGLERVMGKTARELEAELGAPDQDMKQPTMRRLVFASTVCVLDAYLYPPAAGKEPVTTWVDARLPSGDDMDRASCVAALTRR